MKTRTVVDQVSFKRLISLPLLLLLAFPFQTAYPFVLVPVVLSFFVNLHHILATYPPRKKAGVKRPRQYANWDEAEKNPEGDLMKFNIAQRSHANFLESVSAMLQIDDYGDLISSPPPLFSVSILLSLHHHIWTGLPQNFNCFRFDLGIS